MRSLEPQKIAALALAVLFVLAGGVAIVHFRIPQTDFSMLDDSNIALTPHSPRAAKPPSHAEAEQLAIARTAAGQVDLAAIPDPALISNAPAPHIAPPPPAPQTKAPAPSQFTLSAHDLDTAFHPSHKYKPSLASGADQVALASFGPTPPTPRSAAAPTDDTQSEDRLIDANLKMEEDRRFVMSMCEDHQGRLWVGSEEDQPGTGGVQCFDPSAPPLHQWTKYTTADGLGDNNGYAIACDHLGRIWVGHLNHGVSVFNGKKWQNYEVVGGLSRPDSLSGPLGERIFAIKTCPSDGDVWIASSCGLARYSEHRETWSYLTRAEGLPSDQANAIAFDHDGNIFVGTQCDGIAMADASDNYKFWRTCTGPEREPTTPSGDGLPSSLIDDVLVARDGTVYAATTTGLAWSNDRGVNWKYTRGANWADKVRGLYGGPPTGWNETPGAKLAEDYSTCLAEDASGQLLVGHRRQGFEAVNAMAIAGPSRFAPPSSLGRDFATSLYALSGRGVIAGTYGGGLIGGRNARLGQSPVQPAAISHAVLPSAAQPPGHDELLSRIAQIKSLPSEPLQGAYLGEDWTTQGDWVGRYGRQHNILCGSMPPFDQQLVWDNLYQIDRQMGPHPGNKDSLRAWLKSGDSPDPRCLYDPIEGTRSEHEWDDHGENFGRSYDGPDLWITVKVTPGTQRISLYFVNYDGHVGENAERDFDVELFDASTDIYSTHPGPALARARVQNFWGGAYKQFLVQGPGSYRLKIARRSSLNTMVAGAFIDRVAGQQTYFDTLPLAWLGEEDYGPPTAPVSSAYDAALELQVALNLGHVSPSVWRLETLDRRLGLRSLGGAAPEALTANWRWGCALWTASDRRSFANAMNRGWDSATAFCPQMNHNNRIPLTVHLDKY